MVTFTATVTANGTSLSYFASVESYEGQITLNPGADVTVTVEVNGHTYRATERQVSTFPTIVAPTPGTTWDVQWANLVSWSGTAPSSTAQYISGVFDSDGNRMTPTHAVKRACPGSHDSRRERRRCSDKLGQAALRTRE